MKDWKARLIKALIEALIAFLTAYGVASCTRANIENGSIDKLSALFVK